MKSFVGIILAVSLLQAAACGSFKTPTYEPVNKSLLQQQQARPGLSGWPDLATWEEGETSPQDVAIIVGVEEYAFLPPVAGAVSNATDWETYFRTHRGMENVYVLTNQQATREEINRFAKQATEQAAPDSTVWFVFIGHGASLTDGSDGAMIGMDAQQTITSIEARSVKRSDLLDTLERGPQENTVVVLDTCFSGRDPEGNLLAKGTQPVVPVNSAPQTGAGTVILSAAASNQVAGQLPGAERPAFSYLLLGALRGWADDGDGVVNAREAVSYTEQQLRHVKGRQQTPGLDGSESIVLASASEKDPGVVELVKGNVAAPAAEPMDLPTGTLLDSRAGLYFVKPDGWIFSPIGMGLIISMRSIKGGSTLHVYKQEMDEGMAAGWFDMEPVQGAELIRDARKVEYGPVAGYESEYHLSAADYYGSATDPDAAPTGAVIWVWEAYSRGAGWRVTLTVPKKANERPHYEVFQQFVSDLRFP